MQTETATCGERQSGPGGSLTETHGLERDFWPETDFQLAWHSILNECGRLVATIDLRVACYPLAFNRFSMLESSGITLAGSDKALRLTQHAGHDIDTTD